MPQNDDNHVDAFLDGLRRPAGHDHTCEDCGNAHFWPVPRRGAPAGASLPLSQPVAEQRVTLSTFTGLRTPFRAAQAQVSCDHHHPGLDRAAVRRLLRSLGPDFGPEPPAGGSLARV